MKMYLFEGTPAEISNVMQTLGSGVPFEGITKRATDIMEQPEAIPDGDNQPRAFVTTEFARQVLKRRSLSGPIKAVLKTLARAPSEEWVSTQALYKASGYEVRQFSGLMGAFGRRVAHTEGYNGKSHFFDFRWNDEESTWDYRLPQSVREAVKAENLI